MTDEEKAAYAECPYYSVGIPKLIVLFLCTLGLYLLYWFHMQWLRERDRTDERVRPFLRALFSAIWAFSLFARIHRRATGEDIPVLWSPEVAAIAFLVLSLTANLPDPYWLVALFTFLPIIPVQRTINTLNANLAPDEDRNTSFGGAEIALVLVGGLLFMLVIVSNLSRIV